MKKWTLGLLALVFLALCACSAADAESTAAGIYLGQTVKLADADWVPVDTVYDANSCRLELNSCGEGFLWLDGERSAIRWSQSGGHLTLKSGRQRSEAELQDGIITAQLFASEIWMCFVREDLYQPPESTSEPEAEKEPDATSASEPDASGDPWSFWSTLFGSDSCSRSARAQTFHVMTALQIRIRTSRNACTLLIAHPPSEARAADASASRR